MAWPPFALFAVLMAYVLIDGTAQGGITARNRQYVPPVEQPAINTDLHRLLPLLFCLLLATMAAGWGWKWPLIGGLLRLALFDAALNRRKGDPLFATGRSAALDKLLARAPALNPLLRTGALAAALALLFLLP